MKFHKAFYKTFSPYFSPKYFKNIFPKYFIKINYSEYKHSTYVLPKFHKIPKVFFKCHFFFFGHVVQPYGNLGPQTAIEPGHMAVST